MNVWFGTWSPRYYVAPPWRMINRRPPPPQWVVQHTWRPARPPVRPPSMGAVGQQRPTVVRPAPISGGRAYNSGNTSAPGPDNLRHRPSVPQNRRTATPTPAPASAAPAPAPRAQTRSQAQTPPAQNNNGNTTTTVPATGNRRVIQRPSTPPPVHYAPQSQGQPEQQTQQQVRQSGQQSARQAGQENREGASNAAPTNSSRPAPPPQSSQQQQQSTQSSSSSNSSSSSSDSGSRSDSGGRPRR